MSEPAPTTEDFDSLADAVTWAGLEIPAEHIAGLDAYRQLLWQWNENINLTRHTTLQKFAGRDLLDTVRLSEHLDKGDRVLDIGSGGGVPGLPLAILRPDLTVSVCDSVGKKAKVLEDMVQSLGLPVTVYPARAEQVLEITTQGTLIARGVASLKKLLTWLEPHWEAFDQLLLIKGKAWVEERGEARHHGLLKDLDLRRVASYESPLVGESVLLRITQRDSQ
ncbi:16S rRNA (guanine(527)-N(7))-methyltransferase RsmG [Aeoliella sp. ICT_H6.2]|uniref:Ribosomal RNA small subunit methyltransferase G n=1 Tax=Aeoliella straminimaris TaxID=2954799 RepID=A0A9X2JE49_9BACT|nr:16S rRNA (guanine(527)-N(7))-methyltransferase RsmG [Aeoliella straminimaris]MCO6042281.1 16S rRNA (guanine(527)-N(7))-methyltransferase RsmG [Aeoliella straminimaris]